MDEVISPDLASLIYEQVRDHIIRRAVEEEPTISPDLAAEREVKMVAGEEAVKDEKDGNADVPSTNSTGKRAEVANDEHRDSINQSIAETLEVLDRAYNHEILYIIGKEQMRVKKSTNILRNGWPVRFNEGSLTFSMRLCLV